VLVLLVVIQEVFQESLIKVEVIIDFWISLFVQIFICIAKHLKLVSLQLCFQHQFLICFSICKGGIDDIQYRFLNHGSPIMFSLFLIDILVELSPIIPFINGLSNERHCPFSVSFNDIPNRLSRILSICTTHQTLFYFFNSYVSFTGLE
jgi:hypothetical protein